MLRRPRRALFILAALTTLSVPRTMPGQDAAWRADFEFVIETVARESAALVRHRIDWKGIEQRYRLRLNTVRDDVGHITMISELLAECRDSHTGLVRHDLRNAKLPSKWDGLASAGLWIVEDEGRFHVAGRDGNAGPPPGATLATIGDWPFHLAMERELRRCSIVLGISSRHSFFASIGNRCVPMGEATAVELGYLDEGKLKRASVSRWGPSGRGFDLFAATVPEGLKHGEGAVATMLDEGKAKIGYVRITGSMNSATAKAFHGALDGLKGADAIVLDCRGMGGGSDDSAWEMAGRFFVRAAANGSNGRIEPSGPFQHGGPVVMIQDSLEVSSAETFTWAMSETGRALSVGRPTGGWSIIPRRFFAPSGKFDFRVGVTDRKTPIKGLLTEGIGWAPDVLVPLGPMIAGETRLQTDLALAMARAALAGGDVEKTRDLFALLGRGRWDEFRRGAKGLTKRVPGLDLDALADLFAADLEATLQVERQLLELVDPPDCLGAARRLDVLRGRAHTAPAKKALAALDRRLKSLAGEARAQQALLDALDRRFSWSPADRDRFLAKAGKTRYGAFAREHLPAR